MQSSVETAQQRKFALGTWSLAAVIAILVSIAASLLTQWGIGSPQLLVITIASLLLAALFISVYRSRGRFRLHALLVLMTLVGVGSATIGRRIVFVEKHRALARMIAERKGQVIVWGASGQEFEGWRMIAGGYVIPSWLHPLYDYFVNIRVGQITIPADLLTMENLELLTFDDEISNSELILEGTHRDQDALLKFSSFHKRQPVSVYANHLTDGDVQYLSVLNGKKLYLTLESPNFDDIKRLRQIDAFSLTISNWKGDLIDASAIEPVTIHENQERLLQIDGGILSREAIASIESYWQPQSLAIFSSVLGQGAFDELANLKTTRYLMINSCKVTDADLLALSRNDQILHLRLIGTQITDKGLETLASMKNLENVELSFSKCTWQGIQKLCRNLKLESISTDVSNEPNSTAGVVQPILYQSDMIREHILGKEPETAENPTDE